MICIHELVWVFNKADSKIYTCRYGYLCTHSVCYAKRRFNFFFDAVMYIVHTLQRHGIMVYRNRNGTHMEKTESEQESFVVFFFFSFVFVFSFQFELCSALLIFKSSCFKIQYWIESSLYTSPINYYYSFCLFLYVHIIFFLNQLICTKLYVPVWAQDSCSCCCCCCCCFFLFLFLFFDIVCDIWLNVIFARALWYIYDGRLVNINEFIIEGNWATE